MGRDKQILLYTFKMSLKIFPIFFNFILKYYNLISNN